MCLSLTLPNTQAYLGPAPWPHNLVVVPSPCPTRGVRRPMLHLPDVSYVLGLSFNGVKQPGSDPRHATWHLPKPCQVLYRALFRVSFRFLPNFILYAAWWLTILSHYQTLDLRYAAFLRQNTPSCFRVSQVAMHSGPNLISDAQNHRIIINCNPIHSRNS